MSWKRLGGWGWGRERCVWEVRHRRLGSGSGNEGCSLGSFCFSNWGSDFSKAEGEEQPQIFSGGEFLGRILAQVRSVVSFLGFSAVVCPPYTGNVHV